MPMTIQTALLPHKHVRFSDSIIGLAGLIRKIMSGSMTADEIWATASRNPHGWPSKPSFTHVVLALDVLYALGQIEHVTDGRVRVIPNEAS